MKAALVYVVVVGVLAGILTADALLLQFCYNLAAAKLAWPLATFWHALAFSALAMFGVATEFYLVASKEDENKNKEF